MVRTFRGNWVIFDIATRGLVSGSELDQAVKMARCSDLNRARIFKTKEDADIYGQMFIAGEFVSLSTVSMDVPWDYATNKPIQEGL